MMRNRMMKFMTGRYGLDQFSNFLMILACVILFINLFFNNIITSALGIAIMIYGYVRVFSRNRIKRADQNTWFLNKTYGIRMKLRGIKSNSRTRKTHHIFKCPDCRQKVRVPRGKGRIEISCPKCRSKFIKNS